MKAVISQLDFLNIEESWNEAGVQGNSHSPSVIDLSFGSASYCSLCFANFVILDFVLSHMVNKGWVLAFLTGPGDLSKEAALLLM